MSNTPIQEPLAGGLSSGSGQTIPSRPFQPTSDPSASKRVCFYKSGDYKFSGHRMVINARTFKTFDALLDALSKKVPLPFGVRTITTPRGTHLVRALDDLHDGGSYVCSDRKRVKPLNLDEVNRRQVPWNTTRPFSAGRRRRQGLQFGRGNDVNSRIAKVTERVAVRTPKKLVVIKNKDPTVKRTIVLQRRTAPTFDALLDYLSQILEFPVLKLFSIDGRRVDGLAALILCSGVVVAAGNEPFRLGNYIFHQTGQMASATYMETVDPSMLQPKAQNNKSLSSGRGSRNFSLSSERYIIDQVNKSRNGSMYGQTPHQNGSFQTNVNHHRSSVRTCESGRVNNGPQSCIVPQEDDIEKSFRVNQDGSMTVEMKVHLTIKEEELLHWTTTLSRSSLNKRAACSSISESGNSSPDSNNAVAKDSSNISDDETKEENRSAGAGKGVGFSNEREYKGYDSAALGKAKTGFKRTPTPGPRHVNKKASVESVKTVSESGVQENTLGRYSYMERTPDGETTEGYCVIRHSSTSNKPVPKPRKTASAGASKKGSHSSIKSSGVAEVLQIQNNGMEVTETVMHIYESQRCYDNYFANEDYSVDSVPLHDSTPAPDSKPSTVSEPHSSSNDIDFSTTDSLQRQKEEMLSLSSEPITSTRETSNNLSRASETRSASNSQKQGAVKRHKTPKSEKQKKTMNSLGQKSSTPTSNSDKKQKETTKSPSKHSKHSSTDQSNASGGKKSLSSSESAKSGKSRGAEKTQIKKVSKDEKTPKREQNLSANTENLKKSPSHRQNLNKSSGKDNGHNVNTPTGRPQMKKNLIDILQPKKSILPVKKTISKPKSVTENRISPPNMSLEISESLSMPSLSLSPCDIHQYVENWLEKASPDPVPYTEEAIADEEPRTKVVFQIGADSDPDERSYCQTDVDDHPSPAGAVQRSVSGLSVPLSHAGPGTSLVQNDQYMKGLCVSMPSVRVDPLQQENRLRAHKSAEAVGPAGSQPTSSVSTPNILSPKAKIKPALQQLCSSIQCIRRVSDSNITPSLEKSSSLPDFPTQVASVFGSSCKAFLSFLSVMTLRESLTGSELEEGNQSRSNSEAKLMLESLQKISAIEDEEEQRASLTDLRSRASSAFRDRWRDFQILRERLESEPLSPKVSETEFALDVVSEGGDVFDDHHSVIDELMEELNMPQDLRAQISSTIQQARSFYPVEESTFVETERNQSDSEEDVEKFVEERDDETEQLPESDNICIAEDITQTKQGDDDDEGNEQAEKTTDELEQVENVQETDIDVKESEISQSEIDESLKHMEEDEEEKIEEDQEDAEPVNDSQDRDTKERDQTDGEETAGEAEEEAKEWVVTVEEMADNMQEAGSEEEEETVEKVEEETEEQMTVGEDEGGEELDDGEAETVEEADMGLMDGEDQETRGSGSVEDTEEDEKGEDEVGEEADEEDEGEEGRTEEMEEVIEGADQGAELDNVIEEVGADEEKEEDIEENEEEMNEEKDEDEEVENVTGGEEEEEIEETNQVKKKAVIEMVAEDDNDDDDDEREKDEAEEEEEETAGVTKKGVEEEVTEGEEEIEEDEANIQEKDEEEEVEEEEETDVVTKLDVVVTEGEEDKMEDVTEDDDEEDAEEQVEGKEKHEVVSEENEEEEEREKNEEREEEEGEDVEIRNVEERVITDEEEDEDESARNARDRECDEDDESRKECEERESSFEEESVEEKEVAQEVEMEENMQGQTLEEEEEEEMEDEEENETNVLVLDEVAERESKDEEEEENVSEEAGSIAGDRKTQLEEASYLQHRSCDEEDANAETKEAEPDVGSPAECSSEGHCEDDKGNGTDTGHGFETDEGGEGYEGLPHPVEISQELLDFVNSALQSSSLIFTYDERGNIRIEPDNARVTQTKQIVIPKSREDSSYGLRRLPTPSTSDLSDYRPETSESGGYKSQDSVDVITESGEESSERTSPFRRREADVWTNVGRTDAKPSSASNSDVLESSRPKSGGSFSSVDSRSKASREDLSYFSAGSSQKAFAEPAAGPGQCVSEKDSCDGVLIDKGRWLLKENHLIRKSPPVCLGMYGNADSTSVDTGQDNMSQDSPPHNKTQPNPLTAISSSELEEMAKPQTPKCIYYNMPHGSDSDPFLDDNSYNSRGKNSSSGKGRGVKVSPTIDTTKTWANKNGSLSSFASVEFKMQDRKVHPEGESSAVTQPRRTSSGGGNALQSQDSLDTLHVRCGQYCPIL